VKALARSADKAETQFAGLSGIDVVIGDLRDVRSFASALSGTEVLYHTAAFFRDAYKGGRHRRSLAAVNEAGTVNLIAAAYASGIRRMIHTSSTAVLMGAGGKPANEMMLRPEKDADDYYLSKIRADRAVLNFLETHPDMFAAMILPGWMHGPGDIGPTSAGQLTLDYVRERLPGIPPGGFSFVDARDVALAMIAAAQRGRRGERYLVAGYSMTMPEIFAAYEHVTDIRPPRRRIPAPVLRIIALFSEFHARLTGRPVLLSLAGVRMMLREAGRRRFDSSKAARELGARFRPVETTLADEIAWYRAHEWLPKTVSAGSNG
jgi:nucleoside-diphosphate-sugar epimerase